MTETSTLLRMHACKRVSFWQSGRGCTLSLTSTPALMTVHLFFFPIFCLICLMTPSSILIFSSPSFPGSP